MVILCDDIQLDFFVLHFIIKYYHIFKLIIIENIVFYDFIILNHNVTAVRNVRYYV